MFTETELSMIYLSLEHEAKQCETKNRWFAAAMYYDIRAKTAPMLCLEPDDDRMHAIRCRAISKAFEQES